MGSKKERIIALLQQGWSFKKIAKEVGCSRSTVSFHANRMKYEATKSKYSQRYDWNEVQNYHDHGHSREECMKEFGFSLSAWERAVRTGKIESHDTRQSLPKRQPLPIERLLVSNRKETGRANLKYRLIKLGLLEKKCAICGITEWMGKPLAFDLDHINGTNNDNRLENLRLLCPNCHSQTETHAGKNRVYQKKKPLLPEGSG